MSKFKKALKKKELGGALEKHLLRELDEAVKKDYVKGLVFIAIEDENFSEDEKAYVTALMSNIGVDEGLLGEFESFASEPDEDELLAFMDKIKAFDEDLKVNFLIEVILLAFKDGDFDDAEKEMFNDYIEMLELEEKKDDIMHLAMALENKDIDLALAMYTAKKEFFMKYDYMFDMIHVDIEKELNDTYSWNWVRWDFTYGGVQDNNKVSHKPVSTQQFIIFLNSLLIKKSLKPVVDSNRFEYENEVLIYDLDYSNLTFTNNLFISENKEEPIVGFSTEMIELFISWVHNYASNVDILKMYSYGSDDSQIRILDSCIGKPTGLKEFFYMVGRYSGYSMMDPSWFAETNSYSTSVYEKENSSLSNITLRLMKIEEEL